MPDEVPALNPHVPPVAKDLRTPDRIAQIAEHARKYPRHHESAEHRDIREGRECQERYRTRAPRIIGEPRIVRFFRPCATCGVLFSSTALECGTLRVMQLTFCERCR